jgi:hypothetical protein
MQEVTGSIPVTSTKKNGAGFADPIFLNEDPQSSKKQRRFAPFDSARIRRLATRLVPIV